MFIETNNSSQTKKARSSFTLSGLVFNNPGGFLLSHAVARAVPSAPRGLTSVFGMGTGVALSTEPPENFSQMVFGLGTSVFVVINAGYLITASIQKPQTKSQRPRQTFSVAGARA